MANPAERGKVAKSAGRIKNSQGWLQLVFVFKGRRRYLSLDIEDSKSARSLAQMKAKKIWLNFPV